MLQPDMRLNSPGNISNKQNTPPPMAVMHEDKPTRESSLKSAIEGGTNKEGPTISEKLKGWEDSMSKMPVKTLSRFVIDNLSNIQNPKAEIYRDNFIKAEIKAIGTLHDTVFDKIKENELSADEKLDAKTAMDTAQNILLEQIKLLDEELGEKQDFELEDKKTKYQNLLKNILVLNQNF